MLKKRNNVLLLILWSILWISFAETIAIQEQTNILGVTHSNSWALGWTTALDEPNGFEKVDLPHTNGDGYFRVNFVQEGESTSFQIFADDCVGEIYVDGRKEFEKNPHSPCLYDPQGFRVDLDIGAGRHILGIKTYDIGRENLFDIQINQTSIYDTIFLILTLMPLFACIHIWKRKSIDSIIYSGRGQLIISLALINLLLFVSSAYIVSCNDGSHYALVSALVEKHSTEISEYMYYTWKTDYATKDGKYFSDRVPGTAFLAVPFFALGKLLQDLGFLSLLTLRGNLTEIFIIFLPNLAGTASVALLYMIYLRFGFSHRISLMSSILSILTTLTWFESTHLFSHSISQALVLAAVYTALNIKGIRLKPLARLSFLLALSAIVETQNLFFSPIFIAYLLASKRITRDDLRRRGVGQTIFLCMVIFFMVYSSLLAYNLITFNMIAIRSNIYNPRIPWIQTIDSTFSGDPLKGADMLLTDIGNPERAFDWSKGTRNETPGVFILSPILLLSAISFRRFLKDSKVEAVFFITLVIVEVGLISFYSEVLTRHITTIIPYIFFPLAYLMEDVFEANAKGQAKVRQRLMKLIILFLSISSALRVFYVMNTYWGRNLAKPFMFTAELRSFAAFWLIMFLIYIIVRRFFGGKRA